MQLLIGFDIGGTKCSVSTGVFEGAERLTPEEKAVMKTDLSVSPEEMLRTMAEQAQRLLRGRQPDRIGISCGGPLDPQTGCVQGPPNLPGWENVPAADILRQIFRCPVSLKNDADACAIAEWKFGNGRGCRNLVFLTFGTGMGAGLILNGRLYQGANGMAGEIGHIRMAAHGPAGYGKCGSFEGFCSGGGIAQLAYSYAVEGVQRGSCPAYFLQGMRPEEVTAQTVAQAAAAGDETALKVYRICGEQLGRGLSILIDLLNPERIILGSVYARAEALLRDTALEVVRREALERSRLVCEVLPAGLGEKLGDYAALAAAIGED